MNSFTPNLGLALPATNDPGWDATYNGDLSALDALTPVGALAVSRTENPSASLRVKVAAGRFVNQANGFTTYTGTSALTLTALTTTYIWLTNAGVLTTGSAWPAPGVKHVPLAIVAAGATAISTITDARVAFISAG